MKPEQIRIHRPVRVEVPRGAVWAADAVLWLVRRFRATAWKRNLAPLPRPSTPRGAITAQPKRT